MKTPFGNLTCAALVKPGSALARSWKLTKPSYAIYEYSKAFGSHVGAMARGKSFAPRISPTSCSSRSMAKRSSPSFSIEQEPRS